MDFDKLYDKFTDLEKKEFLNSFIEQAVDRLPEEIKETAIFFFFQEIKQKEIVDLLNRRSKESSVEYSAI